MARQRRGLTIGQLLSLTLGFLIASVVIFIFGMWVGSDVAKQRQAEERQIVRLEVATPPRTPTLEFLPTPSPITTPPTPTEAAPARPSSTSTPYAIITTPTRARPALPWAATPTAGRQASPAPAAGWSVQVKATTDLGEALREVQRMRAKGYDAYTRRREIAGATWYRVRVGQFATRAEAKRLETQLRREFDLDAAYVTQE